jgi:hypothetical protein
MANLELECPGCQSLLELDAGFAGGVCRCFKCGTLMSVPTDDAAERGAQALRRPARPDQPARTGQTQHSGSFVTADGRSIQLDAGQVVTARARRSTTRTVTAVVFFALVLIIAGVAVGVFVLLVQPPPSVPADQATRQTLGYDPVANPYTLSSPNVLGLPLRGDTAVVVEASGAARSYLDAVNAALRLGLTQFGDDRVRLVYATADGPAVLDAAARPTRAITATAVAELQEQVRPRGVVELRIALAEALQPGVDHLVLILPHRIEASDLREALSTVIAAPATIDIIHIDAPEPALRQIAETNGGRYLPLTSTQLADWYRAAP